MNKKSQRDQILDALKAGDMLTGIDALSRFRCFSLPQRIKELKDAGYPIAKKTIASNGKHFAGYFYQREPAAV